MFAAKLLSKNKSSESKKHKNIYHATHIEALILFSGNVSLLPW